MNDRMCAWAVLAWVGVVLACALPLAAGQQTPPPAAMAAPQSPAPPLPDASQAPPTPTLPQPTAPAAPEVPPNCPAYPPGFKLIAVPDPLSGDNPLYPLIPRPEPQVGECFSDPYFGTLLRRVTATDGINGRHEYARHDPYNAGRSLILLISEDGSFNIYRTASLPYNQPANLVMNVTLSEPRWDPQEPTCLWGLRDFKLLRLDVHSQQETLVKDFAADPQLAPLIGRGAAYRVTMMDEGEPSGDMRLWALALQGNASVDYRYLHFFTWDAAQDRLPGIYPPDGRPLAAAEAEVDWVGMSPLGNWVLIGGMENNGGQLAGLTMAPPDFSRFQRLDFTTAHADVGLDAVGREVVVMQSTNTDTVDLIPLDPSTQPILQPGGSDEGSGRLPLLRLYYASGDPHSLNSGVHISCNAPGWCFISTTIAPGVAEQNWLDRSLLLVRLDPHQPQVFYVAKLYNTTAEEPRLYWDETHGSSSRDGQRLLWAENWGLQRGEAQMFLMEMVLPGEFLAGFDKPSQ